VSYIVADARKVRNFIEEVYKPIYEKATYLARKRNRLFRLYLVYAAKHLTSRWWYFGTATPEDIENKMMISESGYSKPEKLTTALRKYDAARLEDLLNKLLGILRLCETADAFSVDGFIRLSGDQANILAKAVSIACPTVFAARAKRQSW